MVTFRLLLNRRCFPRFVVDDTDLVANLYQVN